MILNDQIKIIDFYIDDNDYLTNFNPIYLPHDQLNKILPKIIHDRLFYKKYYHYKISNDLNILYYATEKIVF